MSPLLISVDDDFRICTRTELVAVFDKLLADLIKVVDLTVVNDLDGAVFVGQRLRTGSRKVDDRQTTMCEIDRKTLWMSTRRTRPARGDAMSGPPRAIPQRIDYQRLRKSTHCCRSALNEQTNQVRDL